MKNDRKPNTGPLLLVVQNYALGQAPINKALIERGFRVAVARSAEEAREMLDDLRFIETEIDGLIADYRLPDGLGSGVVQDFRRGNPGIPALLVTDEDNIALELWTRAKGIRLSRYAQVLQVLEQWLEELTVAA